MSTSSEIERLRSAKQALKTAITGKGQSVADTDLLDSYAAKVEAIAVTASDDGAGNVTIGLPGSTVTYSDGDVAVE